MAKPLPDWVDRIDWNDTYPRLVLTASYMTRGRPGQKQLAEDILQEAIKLSFGARLWNPKDCTYFQHIRGIMKSLIHAHFNSARAKLTTTMDEATVVLFPDQRPTPEQVMLYQSQEQSLLTYIEARNPNARTLAALILQFDYKTSKEIAVQMNVTQNRVDYLKRQLKILVIDSIKTDPDSLNSPARRLVSKLSGEE